MSNCFVRKLREVWFFSRNRCSDQVVQICIPYRPYQLLAKQLGVSYERTNVLVRLLAFFIFVVVFTQPIQRY